MNRNGTNVYRYGLIDSIFNTAKFIELMPPAAFDNDHH